MRNYVMQEFAANGAKHLVLTDQLIGDIMKKSDLAAQLCRELESFGMSFADAHSPFGGVLDMNCPDETFRPQMLMRHKMALRIAAECGVKTITIHPGSDRFFPEIPLEKHLDLMRSALDELLPEAEKCGVVICIESRLSETGGCTQRGVSHRFFGLVLRLRSRLSIGKRVAQTRRRDLEILADRRHQRAGMG